MADLTYTATLDDKISPALAKIDKNVSKVNQQFTKFGQVLATLAIGSFVQNTIKFADSMVDLSKATNIAINDIVGLSKSFELNGGSAEQARAGVIKLSMSVAEAMEGGKAAQLAFQAVNVSLKDIATLSESDILAKTIEGLSKIQDPAQRLKTATELLGKAAKGVDFTGVASGFKSASDEAIKYNRSMQSVAELNDKLSSAFGKVQLAVVKALEPMADAINKLPDGKIEELINSFVSLAASLAAIAVAMKGLEFIGKIFIFIASTAALVTGGFASIALTVKKTTDTISAFMKGAKRFQEAGKFAMELGDRFKYLISGAGMLAKGLLGVAGVLLTINSLVETFTGNSLVGYLGKAYDAAKKFSGLGGPEVSKDPREGMRGRGDPAEIANREAAANALEKQKQKLIELKAYYADQAKQLESNTQQFKKQGDAVVTNLQNELMFNKISEDSVEIIKAINEATTRTTDEVTKLKDARALLKPEEKELIAIYDMQISKVQEIGNIQTQQTIIAIQALQQQKDAQDRLNHSLETKSNLIRSDESLLQLQKQLETVGMFGDKLQDNLIKLDVERELRGKLNDIVIKQLELENQRAKLGEDNFNREMSQLESLKTAAMTYADARLVAEQKIVDATRKSERTDVTGAVAKRMEELQRSVDPTVMAIQKIDSVTQNMNSAIDKFVETGKFSFADFSRSIIQDLIKIELKAQATKLFSSLMSTGGSFLSSLLGFAGGGNPPVGKPSIVGEKGPELFVPRTAGTVIPNNQLGMGGSQQTVNNNTVYNISAIDARSVAEFFAANRKTMLGTIQLAQKELPYGNR
jgi:lambda family phage tail tape measure protein